MKKGFWTVLLAVLTCFCLCFGNTACGGFGGGSGVDGTYYLVENDEYDMETYFTLRGGKWTDEDGATGEYKVDGDKITFYSEIFGEKEELTSGTIKDGVLSLGAIYGNKKYAQEGAWKSASSSGSQDSGSQGNSSGSQSGGSQGNGSGSQSGGSQGNGSGSQSGGSQGGGSQGGENENQGGSSQGGDSGNQGSGSGSSGSQGSGSQGGGSQEQKPDEKHLAYTLSGDTTYYIVTGIGELTGDIEVPDEWEQKPVKEIAKKAFANTNKVTSVKVGANVETIGEEAFYKCIQLKSVSLGEKVESIPQKAFQECTALEQITIPVSVKNIKQDAFEKCSALSRIDYKGTVSDWASIDFWYSSGNRVRETSNPLRTKYVGDQQRTLYIDDEAVTSANISSATEIKPTAFYGYNALNSVTIGNSVKTIGDSAFYHCDSLQTISFNSATQLTSIGFGAFRNCGKLQSVTISDTVERIEPYAFYACGGLRTVEIGDGVTYIGYSAFQQCDVLSSLTLGNSLEKIDESAFSVCEALTTVTIPASVDFIGKYAFDYSGLQTAYFESPTGWKVNKGIGTVKYVNIEGLENPQTAAKLLILDVLQNGYVGDDWEKIG